MTVHTLPAAPAAGPFSRHAHRFNTNAGLLIAAALFAAVLIAEAVFVVRAAPTLPDIGSYYAVAP